MNAKTLEAVRKHGNSLLQAFPNSTEKDPVALCKKLRRIEISVSRYTTAYCNGECSDWQCDKACNNAIKRAVELLGVDESHQCGLFVNRDPRGFALKLDDVWVRNYNQTKRESKDFTAVIYTDMGGYGILAPDLNQ